MLQLPPHHTDFYISYNNCVRQDFMYLRAADSLGCLSSLSAYCSAMVWSLRHMATYELAANTEHLQ